MSEELNLRQAAERLIYWCGRIERASTEAEENECCNERDKLFAVFRKVDAERAVGKTAGPEASAQREARSEPQPVAGGGEEILADIERQKSERRAQMRQAAEAERHQYLPAYLCSPAELLDLLNDMDRLLSSPRVEEWRQDMQSAPKDGTHVLGFGDGPAIMACTYVMRWDKGDWRDAFGSTDFTWNRLQPTHWRPMLAQPLSLQVE